MSGYWVVVLDMHGTHCKHDSLVSSLVFNNQPRPTHIWMYMH